MTPRQILERLHAMAKELTQLTLEAVVDANPAVRESIADAELSTLDAASCVRRRLLGVDGESAGHSSGMRGASGD